MANYHDFINKKIKEAEGRLKTEMGKAVKKAIGTPGTPKNASVTRPKMATNAVGDGALASHPTDDSRRAVGGDHVKDVLRGGSIELYRLRRMAGSGTSENAASADHSHSNTAFVHYPKEERLRMIGELEELEALDPDGLDPVSRILRANLLNSLRLQMGYRNLGPREREGWLEAGDRWAKLYKRIFRVDEYCDDDGLPRLSEAGTHDHEPGREER